jgi:hypothetical protein
LLFEGRDRTEDVTLINRGDAETTYRIAFKNMAMKEDGTYEDIEVPKSGEQFADPLLRFAPRQVTLAPGASQTVKVMLRKPNDLAAGEYRSHLLFTAIPPENFGKDIEATAKKGEVSVKLLPVYGVSIPVIVREGTLEAKASIDTMSIKGKTLNAIFHRKGNRSLYGDIAVLQNGEEIGKLDGVSLLTPYATRHIGINLTDYIPHAPVTITYRSREKDGSLIAQASMD